MELSAWFSGMREAFGPGTEWIRIVEVVDRGELQREMNASVMVYLAEWKWYKRTICPPSSIVVRKCIVDSIVLGDP